MSNTKRRQTRFPGFRSPNYTMVPDELFDELLPDLSGAEIKALLYIIRRTFGFKRESDTISLSQMLHGIRTHDGRVLDRGAGLSKPTLLQALRSLQEQNIIETERRRSIDRGDEPTVYTLRFADGPRGQNSIHPVVKEFDQGGGQETLPGPWSKNLTTQETVLQETDEVPSKASAPTQANLQGLTPSKFRKASSQEREEGKGRRPDHSPAGDPRPSPSWKSDPLTPSTTTRAVATRGITRIRDVLTSKTSMQLRPHPATARARRLPQQPPQPTDQTTPAPPLSPVTDTEKDAIRAYLADYAPELGDRAPFKSSMTRTVHLYLASSMTIAAFTTRMDSARRRTKATPKVRNKFSYFLALLEEECGLREPPPERAEAARQCGTQASPEETVVAAAAAATSPSAAEDAGVESWVRLPENTNAQRLWQRTLTRLEGLVMRPMFETYLRDTAGVGIADGRLVVETPSDDAADWLADKLYGRIRQALEAEEGLAVGVDFTVRSAVPTAPQDRPPKALRGPRKARAAPSGLSG